jgi:hypothetical protein
VTLQAITVIRPAITVPLHAITVPLRAIAAIRPAITVALRPDRGGAGRRELFFAHPPGASCPGDAKARTTRRTTPPPALQVDAPLADMMSSSGRVARFCTSRRDPE